MPRLSLLPIALVVQVHLAGCAAPLPSAAGPSAQATCSQLAVELHGEHQAQRTATAGKDDAWQAVIPFAVLARYASASSEAAAATARIADLQAEIARRGCTDHGL